MCHLSVSPPSTWHFKAGWDPVPKSLSQLMVMDFYNWKSSVPIISFYKWENQGSERLSCLSSLSQLPWHSSWFALFWGLLTILSSVQFSSVAQSCLTLCDPHGLQHTRLCCSSWTPGDGSNSCISSWWCNPTFSSSVIPISSCLQSSPVSGSFPMSQFFISGVQSIGASASASVLFQWIFWTDFL